MDNEENAIGFSKYYPKYEKEKTFFDDGEDYMCAELCPVLKGSNICIGSYTCLKKCKRLNNSGFEKGVSWIICTELNEYKLKNQNIK
jgi:hypothetical protein